MQPRLVTGQEIFESSRISNLLRLGSHRKARLFWKASVMVADCVGVVVDYVVVDYVSVDKVGSG